MTGFNLPPGCSVRDIPGNRPEDMLAEAIAEGYRLTCERCKSYLSFTPDSTKYIEQGFECDGTGSEFSPCETAFHHKPHFIVEWVTTEQHRICKRCGHDNVRDE